MVCLGVRDKGVVAIPLQARSTDIFIDIKQCHIRLAWALRLHSIMHGVPHSATKADFARLLQISYSASPALDIITTSVQPPSADLGSTNTSGYAQPTKIIASTVASHF